MYCLLFFFQIFTVVLPLHQFSSISGNEQPFFHQSIVWPLNVDQDIGIQWHFVYGLAEATDESILCFAEGRIGRKDDAPHHIMLRRSLDKGRTWLGTQVIVKSKNGESFANPTPVVERKSGKIFLFYAQNFHNTHSEVFYVSSSDHGITWSNPVNITKLFNIDPLKRPFHLPGPGHGIQLKNGRLLMQIWHRFSISLPVSDRQYGVSVVYSDDMGSTWQAGGFVPQHADFPANESRLVELRNNKLLLDARFATSGLHHRIQYTSKDHGNSWSDPSFATLPAFTAVDASLSSLQINNTSFLMATRPVDTSSRKKISISISSDEGKTWPYTRLIYHGPSDYSDAIQLSDGSIFVLYGRGDPRYVASARFNLAWVLAESRTK